MIEISLMWYFLTICRLILLNVLDAFSNGNFPMRNIKVIKAYLYSGLYYAA